MLPTQSDPIYDEPGVLIERGSLNVLPAGEMHLMGASCWCKPEVLWLSEDMDWVEHRST